MSPYGTQLESYCIGTLEVSYKLSTGDFAFFCPRCNSQHFMVLPLADGKEDWQQRFFCQGCRWSGWLSTLKKYFTDPETYEANNPLPRMNNRPEIVAIPMAGFDEWVQSMRERRKGA
jgi:transposase-like protein